MTPQARTAQALQGLDPALAVHVQQVLDAMAAIGQPMVAYSGLRTTQQQQDLYAKGRSTPGDIVTNADGVTKRSAHQDGRACDCTFVLDKGAGLWTFAWKGPFIAYGTCGEALGLMWGGRWKYPHDEFHLEMR